MHFNLAPLATRRDIAMLGLVYRTVLGKDPAHFHKHFRLAGSLELSGSRRHSRDLVDPRTEITGNITCQSALGLAAVYNMLPCNVVMLDSVGSFQGCLQ